MYTKSLGVQYTKSHEKLCALTSEYMEDAVIYLLVLTVLNNAD